MFRDLERKKVNQIDIQWRRQGKAAAKGGPLTCSSFCAVSCILTNQQAVRPFANMKIATCNSRMNVIQ